TFTHSFVGLKPYTRIFAAVRAATAANERGQGGGIGQISPTKQITTMEAAPGPVGDLTCAQDPAGSSRLVCRWQEPVNKNGLIRNYKIKLVDKHDSDRVVFEGDSTNPATTIERNLNFDHTFSLSVSAVTIEEGPVLTIQVKLTEAKLPSAVVEVITQHLLSPPPSSLPVSDNTTECNIYLKLSAIDFTQYSPVSHVGVLVEEESAGASAKTSDGMPYYAYAQGLSKSWEVIAISRTGGVSQNMDDYVFTLGANKRPIQPDNSFNGPLKPSTDYVVEIRFHNKAGYTETSGVNIRTSSKVDTDSSIRDANDSVALSSGAIAGVVIACIAAVGVVASAIAFKGRKRIKNLFINPDA
uniref:Fibronectin type-III domain-containing protein n=1 Tax=Mesocestoides corti TaxID=53468 RepID=A0A5K3FXR7_MESCO